MSDTERARMLEDVTAQRAERDALRAQVAADHDATAGTYFHSGWNAAVREAFLRFDAGQAEDFRHEQRAAIKRAGQDKT